MHCTFNPNNIIHCASLIGINLLHITCTQPRTLTVPFPATLTLNPGVPLIAKVFTRMKIITYQHDRLHKWKPRNAWWSYMAVARSTNHSDWDEETALVSHRFTLAFFNSIDGSLLNNTLACSTNEPASNLYLHHTYKWIQIMRLVFYMHGFEGMRVINNMKNR